MGVCLPWRKKSIVLPKAELSRFSIYLITLGYNIGIYLLDNAGNRWKGWYR